VRFTADEIRAVMADQTYPLKTTEIAALASGRYGKGAADGDPKEVRDALDELHAAGAVVNARRKRYSDRIEHGYLVRYSNRDMWWMDTIRAAEFRAAMAYLDDRRDVVRAKARAVVEFLDPDGLPNELADGRRDQRYAIDRSDVERRYTVELILTEDTLDRLVRALDLSAAAAMRVRP
jgi:hypothetical protein